MTQLMNYNTTQSNIMLHYTHTLTKQSQTTLFKYMLPQISTKFSLLLNSTISEFNVSRCPFHVFFRIPVILRLKFYSFMLYRGLHRFYNLGLIISNMRLMNSWRMFL